MGIDRIFVVLFSLRCFYLESCSAIGAAGSRKKDEKKKMFESPHKKERTRVTRREKKENDWVDGRLDEKSESEPRTTTA